MELITVSCFLSDEVVHQERPHSTIVLFKIKIIYFLI